MSKKVVYKDFLILQSIPSKGKISTTNIVNALKNKGIELTNRTVQRDLNNLTEFFAIKSDNNPDTPGWFWDKNSHKIELPMMSPEVALSFQMVKNYLQFFMPPSVLSELNPYFLTAGNILNNSNTTLKNWQQKISTTSRKMPLLAPKIKTDVLENIYQALLKSKQITAIYKPILQQQKEYVLHPQGLVVVDEVLYLLATTWGYTDVLQFSLHRFKKIEVLDIPCNKLKKFNLKTYIKNGNFLFPKSEEKVEIKLKINNYLAEYLNESKLSFRQKITPINDNKFILTAKVQINEQLKWWILSQGANLEVISPKNLRDEITTNIKQMVNNYK